MYKIQTTTVSEVASKKARLLIQISDQEDLEQSDQYVVFSVLVSTEVKPPLNDPISLSVLQTRALKEAIALLDRADDARRQ